jgi:hypothetical protein
VRYDDIEKVEIRRPRYSLNVGWKERFTPSLIEEAIHNLLVW